MFKCFSQMGEVKLSLFFLSVPARLGITLPKSTVPLAGGTSSQFPLPSKTTLEAAFLLTPSTRANFRCSQTPSSQSFCPTQPQDLCLAGF